MQHFIEGFQKGGPMKKRKIALMLSLIMITSSVLAGCGNSKTSTTEVEAEVTEEVEAEVAVEEDITPEVEEIVEVADEDMEANIDYLALYSPILDRFTDFVIAEKDGEHVWDVDFAGQSGLIDACYDGTTEECLENLWYLIDDFSGDGIDELAVINHYENAEYDSYNDSIIAMYTIKDGKPYLSFEAWSRNNYSFMQNNHLFYTGSGGAAYFAFGEAMLTEDGTGINWVDYYYTYETDDTYENYALFKNNTGEWFAEAGEIIDETDNISKYLDPYDDKLIRVTPTGTLLSYRDSEYYLMSEGNAEEVESPFEIMYASDYSGDVTELNSLILSEDEYSTKAVIKANQDIKDLSVVRLTMQDVTEDGYVSYFKYYENGWMMVKAGDEYYLSFDFPGDTPAYGLTYTDDTGWVHCYAINMSGEDGSLFLSEI